MSVHPQYAVAIMAGRKKVEFRKRPLAEDVTVVWVYATAPVQRVVGYFAAGPSVTAEPSALWRRFRRVGCIDRNDFDRYYGASAVGSVIQILSATRLIAPLPIADLLPSGVPPQSYAYVDLLDASRDNALRIKEKLKQSASEQLQWKTRLKASHAYVVTEAALLPFVRSEDGVEVL